MEQLAEIEKEKKTLKEIQIVASKTEVNRKIR